ncbi:MAG: hypothetical protein WCH03_07405 [Flavobacteriia bacterium]|jgi:hypothetical protein
MKRLLSFSIAFLILCACAKEPTPCECGKNMMKTSQEQDADLSEACEKQVASLPDSEQMNWYNESMECMNEQ